MLAVLSFGSAASACAPPESDDAGAEASLVDASTTLDSSSSGESSGEEDAESREPAVDGLVADSEAVHASGSVGVHEMSQATGDFNGDGLLDVVIGLPRNPSVAGAPPEFPADNRVLILHGKLDGAGNEDPLALTPFFDVLGSNARWDKKFGSAADPLNNPDNLTLLQDELFPGSRDGEALGAALAVGDFDGNGHDDIAIGAPLSNRPGSSASGAVAIVYFYANDEYLIDNIDQATQGVYGVPEDGDAFGETLAAGDFNCDGVDDLAVGVPQEDFGQGEEDAGLVHVFSGHWVNGLSGGDETPYTQAGLPEDGVRSAGDNFGAALAAGQFSNAKGPTGLGCESLAVGSPGEAGRRGAVEVFYGSSQGDGISYASTQRWTQATATVYGAPEDGDEFGAMLGTRVAEPYDSVTMDDLWVVSGGERWAGCDLDALIDPDRGDPDRSPQLFVTVLSHELGGVNNGDEVRLHGETDHYCGLFTPDAVEVAQQYPAIVPTRLGPVVMYLPRPPEQTDELLMTVHGSLRKYAPATPKKTEVQETATGLGSAFYYQTAFHDYVAKERGGAIVSPGMGRGAFVYYREMQGNVLRADHFMNAVVDDLAKLGLQTPDGRFDVFGHSGGGQAVNRYVYLNPDRVDRAVSSAPGTLMWNCTDGACGPPPLATRACADWPHGMGVLDESGDLTAWSTDTYYDPSTLGYRGQGGTKERYLDPTVESSWPDFQGANYNLVVGDDDNAGGLDKCTRIPDPRLRIDAMQDWVGHYNMGNAAPASLCVVESTSGPGQISHLDAHQTALAAQMFLYDEYSTSDFVAQFSEMNTFRQQLEVGAEACS